MSKRWILVALVSTAGLATVVTLSMRDPQPRQVVTAAAQGSDLGAESLPTTTIVNLPVDIDLDAKLNCPPVPPEMTAIPGGTYYDPVAYSGYATPNEALVAHLAAHLPQANAADYEMTGRNATMARFENGRAIWLATFLDDGQWYVTQGRKCWDVQ